MDGLTPFPALLSTTRRTLKAPIGCVGVGLHTGSRVTLRLVPATAGSGIVFRRIDLGIDIPARFDHVADTRLCTVLSQHTDGSGARVGTVEHVMAALAGAGVQDAIVEVNAAELPVLDGSAANFLFLLDCAGLGAADGHAAPFAIEVLRPVRVADGEGFAELAPNRDAALDLTLSIDFAAPAIGRQALSLRLSPASFRSELARARTFTLASEIEALRRAGLALGGSLDNAVVVDGDRVLNPSGLRAPDEFVRHKLLDAVGDLALAGAPLRARFTGHRSGHALNNRLLRALLADAANWRAVPAEDAEGAGFGPLGAWSEARLPLAAAPA
jgi:UDP-3-O-[3-hydroxymyristoyl] N-acetylglucosamine deacetylase